MIFHIFIELISDIVTFGSVMRKLDIVTYKHFKDRLTLDLEISLMVHFSRHSTYIRHT